MDDSLFRKAREAWNRVRARSAVFYENPTREQAESILKELKRAVRRLERANYFKIDPSMKADADEMRRRYEAFLNKNQEEKQ